MTSLLNSLSPQALLSLQREQARRLKERAGKADYVTPDGIVRFVRDILHAEPTAYQEDVLRNLVIHKRAAVRGPHGLGKTAMASWVILWGFTAFGDDVKVPVTASAWRQLTHFTFPEVKKWALKADWSKVGLNLRYGQEILEQSLKLPGREAFPVASDNPALIEGAHARTIVYVIDEAKAIKPEHSMQPKGRSATPGQTPRRKRSPSPSPHRAKRAGASTTFTNADRAMRTGGYGTSRWKKRLQPGA